jgi:large subunit ribosomal protein L3
MINVILGRKTEQKQMFLENGRRIPVTEISVADNTVVQVKTQEKDAYTAVQLGIGVKKRPMKSLAGHAKKLGLTDTPIAIREVRIIAGDAEELPKSGDAIAVDAVLKPGDKVSVMGTSKGKGFAGVVKRHGFRGGPKTHGQSDRHRAPGSIGQGTTPGRVYKGKRMAGRMGSDTVTVANLTVVDIDTENKKLYVSGLVPGVRTALLVITRTGEAKNYVQLLEVKQREDAAAAVESAKAEKEAAEAAANAPVAEELAEEVVTEEAVQQEAVNEEVAETVETASEGTDEPKTDDSEEKGPDAPKDISDEEVKEPEQPAAASVEGSGEPKEEKVEAVDAESSDEPKEEEKK